MKASLHATLASRGIARAIAASRSRPISVFAVLSQKNAPAGARADPIHRPACLMPPVAKNRRPRATSYDVATAAGVAQSTVSRCFQPGSNISDETREIVLATAARLGYAPNALARSLITRRSHAVGVLITRT
ncbi:hypothetical protein G6F65_021200 [Rhizopus arrhizus]|nr:hypothetical protein G6F65_021200 [Rhizopus arrhizus]